MTLPPLLTPKDWKRFVKPGNRLFFGSGPACPHTLIEGLLGRIRAKHFYDLEVVHILTLGPTPWSDPAYRDTLRINALFLGEETRKAVRDGFADYTPSFLSEIPALFSGGILPIDVALIQVAPPDEQGNCSLGVAVDIVHAAANNAKRVIAQINRRMPRTSGPGVIHVDRIDACIEVDEPILELPEHRVKKIHRRIGRYVATLIENGATLQMGIGKIPDAVLSALGEHQDLGVHTEMFSDGLIDLLEKGVVNNSRKSFHPGKVITTFCMGSQRLYKFVDGHPDIEFHPSEYVNHPANIARNDNMVAINSALEVDLSGQVVSDSLGYKFYSGIGGQVDFIRGAAISQGGRPIIALPSTSNKGDSRIVAHLTEGSGVVTSRGDVHYVVTEYGIATLRGRSIRERALELIQVAHPDHREALLAQVRKNIWVPARQLLKPSSIREMGDLELEKVKFGDEKHILRPLFPTDQRRIQEFFYSHEKETLALRYQYIPPRLSRDDAHELVNIDQSRDLAMAIVSRQGPREEIQAVGRYYLSKRSNTAEIAFVVRESKQGLGMGSKLLSTLIDVAKKRGLRGLTASVLVRNVVMRRLLTRHGFTLEGGDEPGLLTARLALGG